jgi:hypothetical protein
METSSIDPTEVVAIASGLAREGASMEINSADLKLEAASAASNGELLNSAVKPVDPMGSMGVLMAILINERRLRIVGFDIVRMFLFVGLVLSNKNKNEAIV